MSINKVILLGNVGKDPDVRQFENGKMAMFTLATTKKGYTLQNGTQVPDRTEWHNIICNTKLVDTIGQYVHKGDKLYIEGELRTRSYDDKQGVKHYVTEIVLLQMEMLTPKQQPQPQPQQMPKQSVTPPYQQNGYQQPQGGYNQPYGGYAPSPAQAPMPQAQMQQPPVPMDDPFAGGYNTGGVPF